MVKMLIEGLLFLASSIIVISSSVDPEVPLLLSDWPDITLQKALDSPPSSANLSVFSLPDTTNPLAYDVHIIPSIPEKGTGPFEFRGFVSIETLSTSGTRQILLHCRDLRVSSVELLNMHTRKRLPISYSLIPENEILSIDILDHETSSTPLTCNLTIEFSGRINNLGTGFFRTSYQLDSETRWLAITQFQPNFARMAFPCFDEPRFKTPFSIRITRKMHQNSISNMPLSHFVTDENAKEQTDIFLTSPMMSTYLVAFAVFDFRSVESKDKKIRVWARPNAIQDANYAVTVTEQMIYQMEMYTNIPYLLPKMDLVAVPGMDFPAMENWGMLTFRPDRPRMTIGTLILKADSSALIREDVLLYNENTNNERELLQTVLVIAHEVVHQWFGNYVTCDRWNYLWLNEGFARYFEAKLTANIQPSWRIDDYFVVTVVQTVLYEDGVHFYQPLTRNIQTQDHLMNMFDLITYNKGGSMLRMLEHMVSPPIFQKALRNYLRNSYDAGGLVNPTLLWNEFELQLRTSNTSWSRSITNLTDMMTKWCTQVGFPLITLMKRSKHALIEQEAYDTSHRSFLLPHPLSTSQTWIIPISYTTKKSVNFDNTQPKVILSSKREVLPLRLQPNEWIIFNLHQTGYYRVNYDRENWRLLTKQLHQKRSVIPPANRAQLIDDSFSLAIDKKISYKIPLSLMSYLRTEVDLAPWIPALTKMNILISHHQGTSTEKLLQGFMSNLLQPHYARLGLYSKKSDSHISKMMRSWIVPNACKMGVELCRRAAKQEYSKNANSLDKIHDDIKLTVFCIALKNNDNLQYLWNSLWQLYQKSKLTREKVTILKAFGCMESPHHMEMYVQKLVSDDIPVEDKKFVFSALVSSAYGITAILSYVQKAAKNITDIRPNTLKMLTSLVKIAGQRTTSNEQLQILDELVSASSHIRERRFGLGQFVDTIVNAREITRNYIEMNRSVQEEIKNALSAIKGSVSSTVPFILRYIGFLIVLMTWTRFL